MERVIVTNPMIGICHMQVCCVKDATNKEILKTCNTENPSGTSHGWVTVHRKGGKFLKAKIGPEIACKDHPDRVHLIIGC